VTRSANPFKDYQETVVARREKVIVTYLRSLRKNRAAFEYITDLAKVTASQVGQVEEEPCSYTTLLRNKRYKALLLEFMATKATANSVNVSEPRAQARIQMLELDLGNVQRDNERLRAYISDLEAEVSTKSPTALPSNSYKVTDNSALQLSNERALVCKALWLVIEHFQGLVSIDANRGCIIDLAASQRNNVIVEPNIAKVFLDWLAENSWVGK
jgi:hypothetical protein